ncbi:LysE family translocator [Labrys neptuniae]
MGGTRNSVSFGIKTVTFLDLMPLAVFVIVATITPGGATTLATASGAHFGFRRSLPLLTGIAAGLASMAASAAAGLGGVIAALPSLQLAMKAVGSLYLVWLAWKIARSASPRQPGPAAEPIGFIGGVWLLWHNPKGWAMTLGAAASFATLGNGPFQLGALLGTGFGLAALLSLSIWCIAGSMLARLLRSDGQWRLLNRLLALMLIASIVTMWLE